MDVFFANRVKELLETLIILCLVMDPGNFIPPVHRQAYGYQFQDRVLPEFQTGIFMAEHRMELSIDVPPDATRYIHVL